eukprot:TRINITY_DN3970_c0_g1_i1.p1 TRINITY_DN3970_c0_g1~~TRINITY_DN3970_c0_g1_i1.p1  ORF type:complete len:1104 (-),score=132.51 TRINITY_DN3970_c0_g1_i1:145-3456(-)
MWFFLFLLTAVGVVSASSLDVADIDNAGNLRQATYVRNIIHSASTIASLVDGGLAQIPSAGRLVVPSIQAAMIYAIGQSHGCYMSRSRAMMITTYLTSSHVKDAVFREVVGWIPMAGNFIRGSVTFVVTEGIGQVADQTLRCNKGDGDFLKTVSEGVGFTENMPDGMGRRVFHVVTDYLVNLNISSLNAHDVFNRVKEVFSIEGQDQLLEKVRNTVTVEGLVDFVRCYRWNLAVVQHALRALLDMSTVNDACAAVTLVAESLWVSADEEARLVVSPYLLQCWRHASRATRRAVVQAAIDVLLATKGRVRDETHPDIIEAALIFVRQAAEDVQAIDTRESGMQSEKPLVLATGLTDLLSAVFTVLTQGQQKVAACEALVNLLGSHFVDSISATPPSSWVAAHHLRTLDRLDASADGSDVGRCLMELRPHVVDRLTLVELPEGTERPCTGSKRPRFDSPACVVTGRGDEGEISFDSGAPRAFGSRSGSWQLEDFFGESIVGQSCALQRLVHSPGHVRLKHKGLWRKDVPLVLLLTGPSGVGKTLLARRMAEVLLGKPIAELEGVGRFRTFHMNALSLVEDKMSLFGPPQGMVGTGELPELLKQWPDAVVLFDEIEKAHPSFARSFLKVFGEHGAVYDPRTGKDISTVRATFVLTSNLAKDMITAHSASTTQDLGDPDCLEYTKLREDVMTSLRQPFIDGRGNFFKDSEVRGRLTDTLPLLGFSKREVELAVRKFLCDEAKLYATSPEFLEASLAWETSVVRALAEEYAQRPEEGLRRVQLNLQTYVRGAMEAAIDTGLLEKGGMAVLRASPHGAVGAAGGFDVRVMPRLQTKSSSRFAQFPSPQRGEGLAAAGSVGSSVFEFPLGLLQKITGSFGSSSASPTAASSPPSWKGNTDMPIPKEWDRVYDWHWANAWQHLWDFLWEWRLPMVVLGVVAIVAAGSTLTTQASVLTAAASSATAPPTLAAALSVAPGAVALLQTTASIASVAVPLTGAVYVWGYREEIALLVTILLALSGFIVYGPSAVRIWRDWREVLCDDGSRNSWGTYGGRAAARLAPASHGESRYVVSASTPRRAFLNMRMPVRRYVLRRSDKLHQSRDLQEVRHG